MSEEVSLGNPQGLTRKQHFHMSAIIENFCVNSKTKVIYKSKKGMHARPVGKKSQEFVGNRCWSHEAETTVSWPIENKFLLEVNKVISGLEIKSHEAISDYHLLWSLRYPLTKDPLPDYKLYPSVPCGKMDKEVEEWLEKRDKVPTRPGGMVAGRFYATAFLKQKLEENRAQYAGVKWQILEAKNSEFLSADFYDGILLIPVHPKYMLMGTHNYHVPIEKIEKENVIEFNKKSIELAKRFFFFRKLYC